jgi:hypothetical protein
VIKEIKMGVLVTDDKWVLGRGKLDPADEAVMKEAAHGDELVLMTLQQALEAMQREEPEKFQEFENKFGESNSFQGAIPLTIEQIVELTAKGDDRMRQFDEAFEVFMRLEVAKQIRIWRVDGHYSWRAIAREVYATAIWCEWSPPSNQIAGMSLCKIAAKLLGEDYRKEPWN